jgi:hypothetical protein
MNEIKNIVGVVAVLLTFVGYIPYFRDILKGKTKPHVYSWFLWGFVTVLAFALQMSDKAGIGAFVTLAAAIMCVGVFFLGILGHGHKDIKVVDTIFLILAFCALLIWLFAKQPIISAILTTTVDLLGFVPTIRKSWNHPYSETLSFYYLNTVRFSLAFFALNHYSVITALYPFTWFLANGLFALMLVIRRKQIPDQK